MMDERLWFRMVVCFLPPLIIVKLVGYSDNVSILNKTSTAVLLMGVALYVFWGRLRGLSSQAEVDVEHEAGGTEHVDEASMSFEPPGASQFAMMAELRTLCQEPERESDRLIAMEFAVNPQISYAEATRSALARKSILEK